VTRAKEPAPDAGRRAFLRGGFVTADGRRSEAARQRPLGPAPPWLAGEMGSDTCAGCDAPCANACPQAIVRRHPADHDLAGVPYLDFAEAGCTFCGDCARACPLDVDTDASAPSLGSARLDRGACLAWNRVVCLACRGPCPEAAITLDARMRPAIAKQRCTGCGQCLGACPAGAIAVHPYAGGDSPTDGKVVG
jgi:ferredoxin-type protein NapF